MIRLAELQKAEEGVGLWLVSQLLCTKRILRCNRRISLHSTTVNIYVWHIVKQKKISERKETKTTKKGSPVRFVIVYIPRLEARGMR